jgi:signal transduction histidine kinase
MPDAGALTAGQLRGSGAAATVGVDSKSGQPPWRNAVIIYALVVIIVFADWLTPAGIVVGMLLCVPILMSSTGDSRQQVLVVTLVSTIGFLVAAILGRGPISPQAVWLPNRVFAMVAIVSSCALSLLLQRRRLQAEAARTEAESARDLSRLLHSLMAHDLRAPLSLAHEALEAVEQPLRSGGAVDLDLISEVDARLRRSLRTTQLVLDSARAELTGATTAEGDIPRVDVCREIREEVASFEEEARGGRKELDLDLPPELLAQVDPSVLRQSVAILVDNAVRHAAPGPVRISAACRDNHLFVSILDSGPGLSHRQAQAVGAGEGLGLSLCKLLAQRAGGSLQIRRDDESGTEFVLQLPVV